VNGIATAPATGPANILVTGNSGVIGRHFRARYGGVAFEDGDGQIDICDAARVKAAVKRVLPDAVLHLAAQSSVAASFEDPAATLAVNFLGTLNLLQALSSIDFRGVFLYMGSADVYGRTDEADLPVKETQPLRPLSPYAVSKVAAESLCYQWSQTQKFRVVIARPFNQIGPGQALRFAVADFAGQIARIGRGERPPVITTGDLDVTRDFTDVRDTVRACKMLLDQGSNGETYNICSGRESSLRAIVTALLDLADVKAEIQVAPNRLRPAEQKRVVGDPAKIRAATGWRPEIPLETTLEDILAEAKENR
jgi:GDP-4-dehydro-6-deoxy-D-mannose reductase